MIRHIKFYLDKKESGKLKMLDAKALVIWANQKAIKHPFAIMAPRKFIQHKNSRQ